MSGPCGARLRRVPRRLQRLRLGYTAGSAFSAHAGQRRSPAKAAPTPAHASTSPARGNRPRPADSRLPPRHGRQRWRQTVRQSRRIPGAARIRPPKDDARRRLRSPRPALSNSWSSTATADREELLDASTIAVELDALQGTRTPPAILTGGIANQRATTSPARRMHCTVRASCGVLRCARQRAHIAPMNAHSRPCSTLSVCAIGARAQLGGSAASRN